MRRISSESKRHIRCSFPSCGAGPPCDCWRAVNSLRFLATGNSHARSPLARLGSQSRSIAGIEYMRWRTHVIFLGSDFVLPLRDSSTHQLSGSETLNSQSSPDTLIPLRLRSRIRGSVNHYRAIADTRRSASGAELRSLRRAHSERSERSKIKACCIAKSNCCLIAGGIRRRNSYGQKDNGVTNRLEPRAGGDDRILRKRSRYRPQQ